MEVEQVDITSDVSGLCQNMIDKGLFLTVKTEATEASYTPAPAEQAADPTAQASAGAGMVESDKVPPPPPKGGGERGGPPKAPVVSAKDRIQQQKNDAMRVALAALTSNDALQLGSEGVEDGGDGGDGKSSGAGGGGKKGGAKKRPKAGAPDDGEGEGDGAPPKPKGRGGKVRPNAARHALRSPPAVLLAARSRQWLAALRVRVAASNHITDHVTDHVTDPRAPRDCPREQKLKKVDKENSAPEELSEYEKERFANMEANKAKLAELEAQLKEKHKECNSKVKLGMTVHVPGQRSNRDPCVCASHCP